MFCFGSCFTISFVYNAVATTRPVAWTQAILSPINRFDEKEICVVLYVADIGLVVHFFAIFLFLFLMMMVCIERKNRKSRGFLREFFNSYFDHLTVGLDSSIFNSTLKYSSIDKQYGWSDMVAKKVIALGSTK